MRGLRRLRGGGCRARQRERRRRLEAAGQVEVGRSYGVDVGVMGATASDAIIRVRGMRAAYGDVTVLRDIDFDVRPRQREIVAQVLGE